MIIQTPKLKSIVAGMGLVAALGIAPTIVAANDDAPGEAPLILAQAATFDDATIEGFAAAQARLAEVEAEYGAEYEAAETEDERVQISQEATEAMIAAVEETPDINVDEYNAVIEAVSEDPLLVVRINEAIAAEMD